MNWKQCTLYIIALSWSSFALASTYFDDIAQYEISDYIQNKYGARVEGRLNIKIKAPEYTKFLFCENELELNDHNSTLSSILTIIAKCDAPKQFEIHLPIKVELLTPVVVTSHTLPRNSILTQNDVTIIEVNQLTLQNGFFDSIESVVGLETKKLIKSTTVLNQGMLNAPKLIKRGDLVKIVSKTDSLTVTMQGVALSDGCKDDKVSVRNSSSKRIVDGRVAQNGEVHVN